MRRRAFFIWCEEDLPWLRYMTLWSFRRWHPDWTIDIMRPSGKDYRWDVLARGIGADIIERPVPKAWSAMPSVNLTDTWRYRELEVTGGVYFDTDIFFVSAFDPVLDAMGQHDTAIGYQHQKTGMKYQDKHNNIHYFSHWFNNIGCLVSAGDNAMFGALVEKAEEMFSANQPQSTGTFMINERFATWDDMVKEFPQHSFYNLPQHLILPFSNLEILEIFVKHDAEPRDCVGIHWYGGDKLSKQICRMMTEGNYHEWEGVLSRAIKEAIREPAGVQ